MSAKLTTRILALAIFGFLGISHLSYSQNTTRTKTQLSRQISIRIDESTLLKDEYTVDIATMGFATEADAKRFFGRITDNRVAYRINMPANQVVVKLHRDRAPGTWTAADWNNYIANKINSL